MKVPFHVLDDFENQTGIYETKVAPTGDADAPIAIVIFKDFDNGGVPRKHQSIFLAPTTLALLQAAIAEPVPGESTSSVPESKGDE